MQSCYGIKPERLWAYYQNLRNLGAEPVHQSPWTKSLMFVSGLHYALSYKRLSSSGSEFETCYGPIHYLDDELGNTAIQTLKRVMRQARGRIGDVGVKLAGIDGLVPNEEWVRLRSVWQMEDEIVRGSVGTWLERNGAEEGWLRLCTAMGILSNGEFASGSFVLSMIQKPFPYFIRDADEDRHRKIFDCIKSFVRDHRVDLEEFDPTDIPI